MNEWRIGDPWDWYFDIPIVSRLYLTASFATTAACALDLVSPFSLYFNYKLIFEKGQVWRLVTNFLFFGTFSIDYLFHMYFLVRYCRLLEENSFRGRMGDFVIMFVFGCGLMTLLAPFVNIPFFGSSLSFMMVYLWGRRNKDIRMNFLGLFPFTAPYLAWVLLAASLVLGSSTTVDLIGIAVGHLYFYLEDVYPKLAEIRGWKTKHILRVPTSWRNSNWMAFLGVAPNNIQVVEEFPVLGGAPELDQTDITNQVAERFDAGVVNNSDNSATIAEPEATGSSQGGSIGNTASQEVMSESTSQEVVGENASPGDSASQEVVGASASQGGPGDGSGQQESVAESLREVRRRAAEARLAQMSNDDNTDSRSLEDISDAATLQPSSLRRRTVVQDQSEE